LAEKDSKVEGKRIKLNGDCEVTKVPMESRSQMLANYELSAWMVIASIVKDHINGGGSDFGIAGDSGWMGFSEWMNCLCHVGIFIDSWLNKEIEMLSSDKLHRSSDVKINLLVGP